MRSFALVLLLLAVPIPVLSSTYIVSPDGSGDFPTIEDAIDAAIDGDIVELTNGSFSGPGNQDVDFLGKAITVRSQSNDPEACYLFAGPSGHRGFIFQNSEGNGSVLKGIKIRGAYVDQGGGGIHCDNASPTIEDCILESNFSSFGGGGVWAEGGRPNLVRVTFYDNRAGTGYPSPAGAALMCDSIDLTDCVFTENEGYGLASIADINGASAVSGCEFRDNNSASGIASVYAGNISDCLFSGNSGHGHLSIRYTDVNGCTFIGNTAYSGAGIRGRGGSQIISDCWFEGNSSDYAAALYFELSIPTFERCTFVGNMAEWGGVVFLERCVTTEIRECTFYGNGDGTETIWYSGCDNNTIDRTIICGTVDGAAIEVRSSAVTPTLTCCDLYGNEGGDWADGIADQLGVNGNMSADPIFCDPENGDFRIADISPCSPLSPDNPECGLIGAWGVGCNLIDAPEVAGTGAGFRFEGVHPNPFCREVQISFSLNTPVCRRSQLSVFDIAGRRLRSLYEQDVDTGRFRVSWDGRDESGEPVSAGVYILRLGSGRESVSTRITRLR